MFAPEEIAAMSAAERMAAMELLWDSLLRAGEDYPSPGWHHEVLAERLGIADSAGAEWLSVEQLEKRLGNG
jgi:hypothetical protein